MEKNTKNWCFLVTILWNYKYDFYLKLSYIKLILFISLEHSNLSNEEFKRWRWSYQRYSWKDDEYGNILAFSAILDPKMKLETLGYFYQKTNPLTWKIKLEKMKQKLYNLFSEYYSKIETFPIVKRNHSDLSMSSSITSIKVNHFWCKS